MDSAEKDLLKIERNSLLIKKRLFDTIQKHRQITRPGGLVEVRCDDVATAINIHDWAPFEALLKALSGTGAFGYSIDGDSVWGEPWGEDLISFVLTNEFDKIYKNISERYHNINTQLTEGKIVVNPVGNV